MTKRSEEQHQRRMVELMEKSFECMEENGLSGVGIRALGKHCGCNVAVFYNYFTDMDDLIVKSTAHCMGKVASEFLAKVPTKTEDMERFLLEAPRWMASRYGKKCRLMYQVYTHPKYLEQGREFFNSVNRKYSEYAAQLETTLGLSRETTLPLIFMVTRACMHYALFEDEFYLRAQMKLLSMGIKMCLEKELTR